LHWRSNNLKKRPQLSETEASRCACKLLNFDNVRMCIYLMEQVTKLHTFVQPVSTMLRQACTWAVNQSGGTLVNTRGVLIRAIGAGVQSPSQATLATRCISVCSARSCDAQAFDVTSLGTYSTLELSVPSDGVVNVALNRPDKSNAMNRAFWTELPACMDTLAAEPSCRVILLTGNGRNFTSGLDIFDHAELLSPPPSAEPSRRAFQLRRLIQAYQRTFTSMEEVRGVHVRSNCEALTASLLSR